MGFGEAEQLCILSVHMYNCLYSTANFLAQERFRWIFRKIGKDRYTDRYTEAFIELLPQLKNKINPYKCHLVRTLLTLRTCWVSHCMEPVYQICSNFSISSTSIWFFQDTILFIYTFSHIMSTFYVLGFKKTILPQKCMFLIKSLIFKKLCPKNRKSTP